jgi:hypothetical protein
MERRALAGNLPARRRRDEGAIMERRALAGNLPCKEEKRRRDEQGEEGRKRREDVVQSRENIFLWPSVKGAFWASSKIFGASSVMKLTIEA